MNELEQPTEDVRPFGHLDFNQQRVHDAIGQYLSEQFRRDEEMQADLKEAIESDDRGVLFTFVWHTGLEDTFLRVLVQDRHLEENKLTIEEEDEAETESTG